jgi:predicted DNA-binding protein (MmcQ/YjbR family)
MGNQLMNLESIREYCLAKYGVEETLPFDEETPVYKVGGKMFLLMNLEPPFSINIKCDPEKAIELREQYDDIIPGWHMSKVHWNTVYVESSLSPQLIKDMIDDSYNLVIQGLPKKLREKFINE